MMHHLRRRKQVSTGQSRLVCEARSPAAASCSCKESRHRSKEHSSPPSSTETELSPSLNHDLARSVPRRMFPLWACSCHDTVQRKIEVVPSNATGTPKPRNLLPCFEFGYMKYALLAGLHGSFSAALCFDFGSWPRRNLGLWQSPLLLCRTRSVCCGALLCMTPRSAWLKEFALLSVYQYQYALIVKCRIYVSSLFCRSVVRVGSICCPPSKNQRWWRVRLPLFVPPLQGWKSQAWLAVPFSGGTGLLQGHLQGTNFNVQFDCKQSPGFQWLHPGDEERQCQQDWAPSSWWEFLPPSRHCGNLWCARNGCHQHLQWAGKMLRCFPAVTVETGQFQPHSHSSHWARILEVDTRSCEV